MDKDNDKLLACFEQTMKEVQLPPFVWNKIAQKLDVSDADVLKDSFEEFYSVEELDPVVGQNIQDYLDAEQLDLMGNAFNQFYEKEVPNAQIWKNIQDKVDISNAWKKIDKKLDNKQKWKQRTQRFTAVALVLLFLQTCLGDGYVSKSFISLFDGSKTTITKVTSKNSNVPSKANLPTTKNSQLSAKANVKQKNFSDTQPLADNNNSTTKSKEVLGTILHKQSLNNNNQQPPKIAHNSANWTSNSKTTNKDSEDLIISSPLNNSSNFELEKPSSIVGIKTNPLENNSTNNNNPIVAYNNYNAKETLSLNNKGSNVLIDEPSSDFHLLRSVKINLLEQTPIELPLAKTLPFSLEKPTQKPNKQFPKFELGLIGKMGTSLLLNELTSEGLRYSSLQDTRLQFTGNIGLILAAKVTSRDAIVAQVSPYSPIGQSYTAFSSEGVFFQKEIKLSYLDFSLGYERDWLVFQLAQDETASIFTRLDIGFSYLVGEQVLVNGESIQQQTFKNWNMSVGLALGNKYEFKNFVLDYGIYGSIGLNDINNNTYLGSQATNLANFGGFLGLRYKL